MEKMVFVCFALIISVCPAWVARAQLGGGSEVGASFSQPVPLDYTYRTARTVEQVEGKKTFWDYLSFFSLPKKVEEEKQRVAAEEASELKMRVREVALQLLENSRENVAEEYVLTVSSFVNLNNLYQVSAFGRYFGEQLIGEMQLAGVEVIDVRKTHGLMIHEGKGEYSLSRDMGELSYIHSAHAVVVGTYTYSSGQMLVNARLLDNNDGVVLSQANVVFDLDNLTEGMLKDEGMPPKAGGLVSVQAYE